jgi:VWFA-related protein
VFVSSDCLLRGGFIGLGALVLVTALRAQTSPDSPSLTIRSSVRLVQIDVIAKDKHGNPAPGLEAKDFTLLDDGVPQKVSRVTVEGRTGGNSSAQANEADELGPMIFSNIHPNDVVPTVILFDVLNTSIEDQPSMKKGLLQSLDHMREGTPVALLILGDDLTVVSDFTTSKISLSKAAGAGFDLRSEGFGPPIVARQTGNPKLDAVILKAVTSAFGGENRERIGRTLTAMRIICHQLSQMRGRKSLLWITGGMSAPPGSTEVEDAIDKLNEANVAVYTVDVRGVLLEPGLSAENDTNDLTQPVKIDREETRGDVLSVVAGATGGVTYRNTNRLDGAISQALADRNLVYVLDYYPRHGDWSGKLHKLRVKTSRPGVRLRYRSSYRATLPVKPTAQEEQEMLAALASSPMDYAGIHFTVQVVPGPASDPRFVLHVPTTEVQWSSLEGEMLGRLQVWFIQKRASGDDLATNNLKADLQLTAQAYQTALSQGVALASDLKFDMSATKVRVMVRDENSGKIGTVDVPVDPALARQRSH